MSKFEESPQWESGSSIADYLDEIWSDSFEIKKTTPHEERVQCLGDRIYKRRPEGKPFYVEYKSGIQTYYTGNVFLETVSVDSQGKPGWVYTCQALCIMYAAVLNYKLIFFEPRTLRAQIEDLKVKFRTVKTGKGQNNGYETHGVIVPLDYAIDYLAERTYTLSPEQVESFGFRPN